MDPNCAMYQFDDQPRQGSRCCGNVCWRGKPTTCSGPRLNDTSASAFKASMPIFLTDRTYAANASASEMPGMPHGDIVALSISGVVLVCLLGIGIWCFRARLAKLSIFRERGAVLPPKRKELQTGDLVGVAPGPSGAAPGLTTPRRSAWADLTTSRIVPKGGRARPGPAPAAAPTWTEVSPAKGPGFTAKPGAAPATDAAAALAQAFSGWRPPTGWGAQRPPPRIMPRPKQPKAPEPEEPEPEVVPLSIVKLAADETTGAIFAAKVRTEVALEEEEEQPAAETTEAEKKKVPQPPEGAPPMASSLNPRARAALLLQAEVDAVRSPTPRSPNDPDFAELRPDGSSRRGSRLSLSRARGMIRSRARLNLAEDTTNAVRN